MIEVVDELPPTVLGDQHTVISLNSQQSGTMGVTSVPASVFDDGSFDQCGDITFEARQMESCIDFDWISPDYAGSPDSIVGPEDAGTDFAPKVPFACCDVADTAIMVHLRVIDEAGNFNSCMVRVTVQDKHKPTIAPPPSVRTSWAFPCDLELTEGFVDQAEDGLSQQFGVVQAGQEAEDGEWC